MKSTMECKMCLNSHELFCGDSSYRLRVVAIQPHLPLVAHLRGAELCTIVDLTDAEEKFGYMY